MTEFPVDESSETLDAHARVVEGQDAVLEESMPPESQMPPVEVLPQSPLTSAYAVAAQIHEVMLRDIRSWAWWMFGFAGLNFVTSGASGIGWGLLLFVVGLGSFIFKDAVMYILYAVTLAWSALSNLLSGQGGWVVFALLQGYWAFQVFRRYRSFRENQERYRQLSLMDDAAVHRPDSLASKIFPWLGGFLGMASPAGVVLLVLAGAATVLVVELEIPDWLIGLSASLIIDIGVLGWAVSLGALLSRYRYKGVAIMGLISSSLVLLTWLALRILV